MRYLVQLRDRIFVKAMDFCVFLRMWVKTLVKI